MSLRAVVDGCVKSGFYKVLFCQYTLSTFEGLVYKMTFV